MTLSQLQLLSPLIVTAATAVITMLAAAFYRSHRLVYWLYQGGLGLALAALAATASVQAGAVTPLLHVDGWFRFFAAFFLLVAIAVGAMNRAYLQRHHGNESAEESYTLLAICALGALVLAGGQHLAALFLGLELISVASFVLAAYAAGFSRRLNRAQAQGLEAGIKYLVLSSVASAFLLFGIALLYLDSGTLAFAGLTFGGATATLGVTLLLVGVAFKLSAVPFHLWTPDVYQGAPTPVTALIATLGKGALAAALLRLLTESHALQIGSAVALVATLAGLSILGGNLLALRQDNIKRLLAYSSIAHMGYLLVIVVAAGVGGVAPPAQAGAFYLVAYGVTTLGAFALVNAVSGSATQEQSLARYRGLMWREPLLGGCFALLLLSLAGIPLTLGFLGKFYVFVAGVQEGQWPLLLLVVAGSALGLYYYLRVVLLMLQPASTPVSEPATWGDRCLVGGLALVVVILGIYPMPLVAWLP